MTTFQEFNTQLHEDVHIIQALASQLETEPARVERVQSIANAATFCLIAKIGARATAHWLHQIADRINRDADGNVH